MAALGRAVVLVEGAERSGARITAGHRAPTSAATCSACPGEAGRRLSEAPNRAAATTAPASARAPPTCCASIGVDDPGPGAIATAPQAAALPALVLDHGGGAVRDVLRALQAASLTIDELAGRCRLPVAKVAAAVSDLEVEGLARRVEGGRYRLLRG